jgi:hypothetical protein
VKAYCRILLLLLMTALTSLGCAGSMKGVLRQGGIELPVSYSQPFSGTDTLQTVLPGGEHFSGEVVEYGSGTVRAAQAGSAGSGAAQNRFEVVEDFEGNKEAVLYGDKGHTMICRFKVMDVITGFATGGYGICQVSDGRVIDLYF